MTEMPSSEKDSSASETKLIDQLLENDQEAYRVLIGRYQNGMLALARSIAGQSIAEEIVQESWVSVLKALPKFERRSSLKTWLYRIVANQAKTRLRKESRMQSLDSDLSGEFEDRFDANGHWTHPPVVWDADALLTSEELKACLDLLLISLPGLQSAALILKEQQGHSTPDVCNILDISESNIRVLLHRARVRLFECIEHFQITGECCTKGSRQ